MISSDSIQQALIYLIRVAGVTLVQLFTLGGPALILIAVLSWLSLLVEKRAALTFGRKFYLLLFGVFGTIIHELGHLVFARATGQRVMKTRLFQPDEKSLGGVAIAADGGLIPYLGLFFFGLGPIIFGPLIIFLALYFLFHDQMADVLANFAVEASDTRSLMSHVLTSSFRFLTFLFSPDHLLDWRLYVFLYIAFAVGSSIGLSAADMRLARSGCLTFIALLFMFNLVLLPLGASSESSFAWLIPYYTYFYVILVFVLLLNLLAAAILWLPASIRASQHRDS